MENWTDPFSAPPMYLIKLFTSHLSFNKLPNMALYRAMYLSVRSNSVNAEGLMEKVYKDERHSEVRLVLFHQVERRLFEQWSMGIVEINEPLTDSLTLIEDLIRGDPSSDTTINRKDIESLYLAFSGETELQKEL